MKILIVLYTLVFFVMPVSAAIEVHQFKDAATEAEYKSLIEELRCLVCQNQNLAGSDAELAQDLRLQTYEMLQQGKTKEQVVEYMVKRYGDFVLYRPPLKSSTFFLWAGPFALLLVVLILVILRIRKSEPVEAPAVEAMDQAKNILSDGQDKNKGEGK